MGMQSFTELCGVRWPIVAMAMNQVSDVNLAVACSRAGILPSLTIFNYYIDKAVVDVPALVNDLTNYNTLTNSSPLLLSISVDVLVQDELYKIINDFNIKAFEIVSDTPGEQELSIERDIIRNKRIDELKSKGCVVFAKSLGLGPNNYPLKGPAIDPTLFKSYRVNGYILKSNAGAGRIAKSALPIMESIGQFRKSLPESVLIINGGVGNAQQVKECLDAGANAVGLGTIFAASEESNLSHEAKLKMIGSTAYDLKILNTQANQQALIFSDVKPDDFNSTNSLILGKTTGTQGHLFAGAGINDITSIKSVAQIVSELTSLI